MKPHFATKAPTKDDQRIRLRMRLTMSHSIDNLTVDELLRSFRLPVKEIAYELALEQNRRAQRGETITAA